MLILWASRDDLEDLYGDPLEIWRTWADDPQGQKLESGHHMAEEIPDALSAVLASFLAP